MISRQTVHRQSNRAAARAAPVGEATPKKQVPLGKLDLSDARTLARLRRNLLRWFSQHARDLPWRRSRDPYQVWVSEIMLQQTTVIAVVPYFERFIARFPTVQELAAAELAEVFRHWEGLGYYSRARNLHSAARQLVDERGGVVPHDIEELLRLPGIGRYTAGAIASLAYDRPAPIVEANTRRVYARLLALRGDPHANAGQRTIWRFAEQAVPRHSSGAFNQALMDLGATVCTPVEPNCARCPVRSCCGAFLQGIQREIPLRRRRPKTTFVSDAMIAVRKDGRYLLRQASKGERWSGLWEFLRVRLETDPSNGGPAASTGRTKKHSRSISAATRGRLEKAVLDICGMEVDVDRTVFELHHSFTRFRIRLICLIADHRRGGELPVRAHFRWCKPSEFRRVALSMPARKFADYIDCSRSRLPGGTLVSGKARQRREDRARKGK